MAEASLHKITLPTEKSTWRRIKPVLQRLTEPKNQVKDVKKHLLHLHNITEMAMKKVKTVSDISKTHFHGLFVFYDALRDRDAQKSIVKKTIPCVASLIIESEALAPPGGLHVSKQGRPSDDHQLERRFVASLVAMGFLCLVGDRTRVHVLPNFSFRKLYMKITPGETANSAKLRMIINYFDRIWDMEDGPRGSIRFIRAVLDPSVILNKDKLHKCDTPLVPLYVDSHGTIEDSGSTYIQVHISYTNILKYRGTTCTYTLHV